MKKVLLGRKEMIKETGVDEAMLETWKDMMLARPEGLTDGKIPFYSKNSLVKILKIKRLIDLRYEPDDVQKIIKRIGLPKEERKDPSEKTITEYLTVGVLAEKDGVSPRTMKHWEVKGIIDSDMRSEEGFRLYKETYVYLCQLIKGLQLFGYTLEEIKKISDHFRDYLSIEADLEVFPAEITGEKLDRMLENIQAFFEKSELFKQGLDR